MGSIFRLVRAFFVLTFLTAIASAIGAAYMKNRLPSKGEPSDDELDVVAIFEGRDLTSTASSFRRLSYTAWYGGGTVDLRGATLDPAGATITVRAVFGGFSLIVPATWRIEKKLVGVMGGIGDTRNTELVDEAGPLVRIEGFAVFGGAGIMSELPSQAEPVAEPETESLPIEPAPVPA